MSNKALFQIPGRGIPIGESITYNSQDSSTGPLGMGWHLGSDTSVTEKSDGSVIYIGSDGFVYQFTPDGKGGYVAPPGIYLKLEKDATGNFKITDSKQNVYTYPNGKLAHIVDRNDNRTIYSYDADGRLAKLEDPSGRDITYAYDSEWQRNY